jgi:acylphosphatase
MADNKRVHVYLTGRVQGVGFRAFTRRRAKKLGIKGWVKNLADGRVEAVFSGPEKKVERMLELVGQGPNFAKVDNMKSKEEDYKDEFNKFEVRY